MQTITLEELKVILAGAANAMPTPMRITKDTAPEYHKRLGHLPADLIKTAVDFCVERSEFFPAVSQILEAANALIARSVGLPTPAEAWGMVLGASTFQSAVICEDSARLRERIDGLTNGDYLRAVQELSTHEETCEICTAVGHKAIYDHKTVQETVRLLGGHQALFTGNMSADRSRFIEAYREIVDRELRMVTTAPSIKAYLASNQDRMPLLVERGVQNLAKLLESPQKNGNVPERFVNSYPVSDAEGVEVLEQERRRAFERGEK